MLKPYWLKSLFSFSSQPPSGGCVLKPYSLIKSIISCFPAAFRRLCVETISAAKLYPKTAYQPPSGGCVLKRYQFPHQKGAGYQPPSGGCVLKPAFLGFWTKNTHPAAFRRLCVETMLSEHPLLILDPAAFRRLCVETTTCLPLTGNPSAQPPSGGCVLKPVRYGRLPALR